MERSPHKRVARLYKRLAFGPASWKKLSFCTDDFVKRMRLEERIAASGFEPSYRWHFDDPKEHQRRIIDVNILRFHLGARFGCETGLEFRDPTSDPEVIACALAIPNEMFVGPQSKWILRTMMAGKLPDSVRLNTRKGRQSGDIDARLLASGKETDRVLSDMASSSRVRSVVDVKKLTTAWEVYKQQRRRDVASLAHLFRTVWPVFVYR
jgi:asparagine synthase (glutamine-hydrolysing)